MLRTPHHAQERLNVPNTDLEETGGGPSRPYARAGGPYRTHEKYPITFDASRTTVGSNNTLNSLLYRWEWGDKTELPEEAGLYAPRHTYLTPGTYNITLTVTGDHGYTSQAHTTCEVESAPLIVHNYNDALYGRPPCGSYTGCSPTPNINCSIRSGFWRWFIRNKCDNQGLSNIDATSGTMGYRSEAHLIIGKRLASARHVELDFEIQLNYERDFYPMDGYGCRNVGGTHLVSFRTTDIRFDNNARIELHHPTPRGLETLWEVNRVYTGKPYYTRYRTNGQQSNTETRNTTDIGWRAGDRLRVNWVVEQRGTGGIYDRLYSKVTYVSKTGTIPPGIVYPFSREIEQSIVGCRCIDSCPNCDSTSCSWCLFPCVPPPECRDGSDPIPLSCPPFNLFHTGNMDNDLNNGGSCDGLPLPNVNNGPIFYLINAKDNTPSEFPPDYGEILNFTGIDVDPNFIPALPAELPNS